MHVGTIANTHPCNDLLDLLFMTLHLQVVSHLHHVDLLPVPQTHNLVKRLQQLKRILRDLPLLCAPAHIRHNAGEKV